MKKMQEPPFKRAKHEDIIFKIEEYDGIKQEPDYIKVEPEFEENWNSVAGEDPLYLEVSPDIIGFTNPTAGDHEETGVSEVFKFLCYKCLYRGACEDEVRNHMMDKHTNDAGKKEHRNGSGHLSDITQQHRDQENIPTSTQPFQLYRCEKCDFLTPSSVQIIRHREMRHIVCDQCDYVDTTHQSLRRHKEERHNDTPVNTSGSRLVGEDGSVMFLCHHCDFATRNMSTLCSHVRVKHEKVRYPCGSCDYVATSKCHIERHVRSVHEKIAHPCSQCAYVAFDGSNLKRHVRNYHELLKCDYCEFTVVTNRLLRQHVTSRHKDMKKTCPLCGQRGYEHWLLGHLTRVHKISEQH